MRIARGISVTNTSRPVGISYDADAAAFFTAASITDTTQKSAVNTLVLSLKSANIWSKMKALYPVVGGVASAHAVNLKTPGTYNLSFATGWTHSSTGMTPNGATYADSNLIANLIAQNSVHFSFYSRTNRAGSGSTMMGYQTATQVSIIYPRFTDNNAYISVNRDASVGGLATAVTNTTGLYLANRTTSTNTILYKNNINSSTNSSNSIAPPSISYCIGVANNLSNFDILQCAFASIGDGLTDTDATNFYNAVQTYQTTLGRQV